MATSPLEQLFDPILVGLKELIQAWGPPGLAVAMVIQALIVPIPSELILGLGGAAFTEQYGFYQGMIIAVTAGTVGSIVGATICFYIGLKGGRLLYRFVEEKELNTARSWLDRWGMWAILVSRLLPFIPFDPISYGAGIAQIKYRDFILPTFVGLVPRAFFYSYLGYSFDVWLNQAFDLAMITLAGVVALLILIYWIIFRRMTYQSEKGETT